VPGLRAAILGCGPRAHAHAEAYAAGVAAGAPIACCDLDRARCDAFAARHGLAQRFADPGEMIRACRPDLLHVVTSPGFRPGVLQVVLRERPRAVLVEKPLAQRPEEAAAWIDGCAAAGVALFVNHQLRYHRPFQRVREVVRSGALGRLEFGRGSCRGNLLEQGTHLFDMLSFVLGDPRAEWVFAQAEGAEGYACGHSAPAYCAGVVCFPGDLHVAFECGAPAGTWRREPNYWWNKGLEFAGERGRAGASTNHGWWVDTAEGASAQSVGYDAEDLRAQAALTESILRALDRPEAHQAFASTARLSFDLVVAAQRSALLRRRVSPHDPGRDAEIDGLRAALAGPAGTP
jgi:predicted dehydrogenase